MAAKILIVDDEAELLELLSINLEREGYKITTAQNGQQALSAIHADRPEIVLLDVMLPDISGVKLTNQLKNDPATAGIGIILLTARDSETDMVVGLSMGADDYVTKPFSTPVLTARIEAVLRRAKTQLSAGEAILVGSIKILPSNHRVFVDAQQVDLTLAEFKILLALAKAKGAVLSRGKLMEEFASDTSVTERTIDVHIAALRKKLGPARDMIKTIHRLGYRIES